MQQFIEFATNHWDLFLALLIILLMLSGTNLISVIRGIKQISPAEATQLINHQGGIVIDVREDKEFAEGHIINSLHIPMGSVQQRIAEIEKYKQKPVIVSCRSGARSGTVCGWLRKHNFENVSNLKGGVMAWQNASLPLSKNGRKK
ncbi:rhodanese-like domain-containing protein [Sulfuriflexus mobilis]|uniref:rhodanese-like domain-containing protein n=1 Tax=Sulfuriflexus mobilis TaxID=1811807 RepID=UPI000F848710|nr:rhodanese-like domain-containing protein [Sulfuriflexus mobilis]